MEKHLNKELVEICFANVSLTIFVGKRVFLVGLDVFELVLLEVGDLLDGRLVGQLNLQNWKAMKMKHSKNKS